MDCIAEKLPNGKCKCTVCGKEYPSKDCKAKSVCKAPNSLPLGDWAAKLFNRIGLTEERYNALRGPYRVCGGFNCILVKVEENHQCGCKSRRDWWNEFGAWISAKWPVRWLLRHK
jgi:hypothetical protein